MDIEEFWNEFLTLNNLDKNTKYFDVFSFYGEDEKATQELTNLVLDGKKKATTSAYLDEEEYPHIGSYSIVLDYYEKPVCVIKTTNTRILRLKDMTLQLAIKEGEGDNLDSWYFAHNMMFEKESKELGYNFSMDMPIFFEEFELVYKK